MSRLVYGDDDRCLTWAAARIGVPAFRTDAVAIGLERDGALVAVCAFDGFSAVDANMHIASDGSRAWLSRAYLTACFAFPFIQCGLRRVTGLVPATNRDALRFDEHLGFRREGYHRSADPRGGDLISLGMLKEWCRFIPQEPSQ
jgi:RimJ/RimL family protein N-acetyltransferase